MKKEKLEFKVAKVPVFLERCWKDASPLVKDFVREINRKVPRNRYRSEIMKFALLGGYVTPEKLIKFIEFQIDMLWEGHDSPDNGLDAEAYTAKVYLGNRFGEMIDYIKKYLMYW